MIRREEPTKANPRICVFCGSRSGSRASYTRAAEDVGTLLGRAGLGLVYGGGRSGLMGKLADACLGAGGHVLGVIPDHLTSGEIAHAGLSELVVVKSMHERKALMASRSDAFLALPGGVGTFEEFFEILTWSVLDLHRKPIALFNVDGYYNPLIAMIDLAVSEEFFSPTHRDRIQVVEHVSEIGDWTNSLVPVRSGSAEELSELI